MFRKSIESMFKKKYCNIIKSIFYHRKWSLSSFRFFPAMHYCLHKEEVQKYIVKLYHNYIQKKKKKKIAASSILNHKPRTVNHKCGRNLHNRGEKKKRGQRKKRKKCRKERTRVSTGEAKEARTLRDDLDCASSALLEREGSAKGRRTKERGCAGGWQRRPSTWPARLAPFSLIVTRSPGRAHVSAHNFRLARSSTLAAIDSLERLLSSSIDSPGKLRCRIFQLSTFKRSKLIQCHSFD